MSSAIKILPHYTYEDYCQWEGKWEVIEGIPYAMSPAPVPKHQNVAVNIASEFRSALKKSNCTCKAYMPVDYVLADDTVLQPDVLIVCKPIQKKFLDFAPALVVEILSPATAMKDRNNKFTLYQSAQVQYYIIVDTDQQSIEIYKMNEEKKYELIPFHLSAPFTFSFDEHCIADVNLSEVWE